MLLVQDSRNSVGSLAIFPVLIFLNYIYTVLLIFHSVLTFLRKDSEDGQIE
jgi:hypothetical protein